MKISDLLNEASDKDAALEKLETLLKSELTDINWKSFGHPMDGNGASPYRATAKYNGKKVWFSLINGKVVWLRFTEQVLGDLPKVSINTAADLKSALKTVLDFAEENEEKNRKWRESEASKPKVPEKKKAKSDKPWTLRMIFDSLDQYFEYADIKDKSMKIKGDTIVVEFEMEDGSYKDVIVKLDGNTVKLSGLKGGVKTVKIGHTPAEEEERVEDGDETLGDMIGSVLEKGI